MADDGPRLQAAFLSQIIRQFLEYPVLQEDQSPHRKQPLRRRPTG